VRLLRLREWTNTGTVLRCVPIHTLCLPWNLTNDIERRGLCDLPRSAQETALRQRRTAGSSQQECPTTPQSSHKRTDRGAKASRRSPAAHRSNERSPRSQDARRQPRERRTLTERGSTSAAQGEARVERPRRRARRREVRPED
jgi:hypothetical protein